MTIARCADGGSILPRTGGVFSPEGRKDSCQERHEVTILQGRAGGSKETPATPLAQQSRKDEPRDRDAGKHPGRGTLHRGDAVPQALEKGEKLHLDFTTLEFAPGEQQ